MNKIYKVGQKVKLMREIEGWGTSETFIVKEYSPVSVKYLVSNGQVDLWVNSTDVKAFGRLIGSKNKTKVAKKSKANKAPKVVQKTGRPTIGDTVMITKIGFDYLSSYYGSFEWKTDTKGVIIEDDGSAKPFVVKWENGCEKWCSQNHVQHASTSRAKASLTMKYILQYELDTDPFELFATMKEVKARIAELAGHRELRRDKIFVYEIAKTQKVELGVSISIK